MFISGDDFVKKIFAFITVLCLIFSVPFTSNANTAIPMPEQLEYGFIECNGIEMEYAVYGVEDGEELLLLPPNGGDMHSLDGSVLPGLAEHYKVITVSPRGTGNSGRGEGKLTFEVMSEDLLVFLDTLEIDKVHIFGFSDGGNLGFVFTLAHQDRVKSLAVMGSNINTLGTNTFDQLQITWQYIVLCVEAWFTGDPDIALRRDIKGMMVGQPSLTFKDISEIKVPVFNIYGEHDMIQRWHSRMITRSIEGARELMVVGGGHSTSFEYTDSVILPALLEFYGGVQ